MFSTEELATQLYISTATISRTAKHLGFQGFKELKFAIVQYTNQERGYSNSTLSVKENISFKNMLIKQISDSFDRIENDMIDKSVELIRKSNSIEIVGVGGSVPNCKDASRKFIALGKKSNARTDWDELRDISKALSSNDLAILISLSGETIHIIEYATNFVENNVPIIAIVGAENSTLENMSTLTFKSLVEPVYFGSADLSSRVALSGILDLLIVRYAGSVV